MLNQKKFLQLDVVRDKIVLFVSTKVPCPFDPSFLQMMVNRLVIGAHRHGKNTKKQRYLERLKGAIEHYERTGNIEFLIDAANYALLEAHYPMIENAYHEHSDSYGRTEKY